VAEKKQLMTIQDFMAEYSISKSKFYCEVNASAIRITKLGSRTYVARVDAEEWLDKIRAATVQPV
jgi:hypothetical protein